jgi:hypothetical protein
VPGNWINCKQGLHQGDSLSPYLFITVADVLQKLIVNASADGLLAHPLSDNIPCPVLQYTDNTLIIMRASTQAAKNQKRSYTTSLSLGLSMNFQKTTLVPMKIDNNLAATIATTSWAPPSPPSHKHT